MSPEDLRTLDGLSLPHVATLTAAHRHIVDLLSPANLRACPALQGELHALRESIDTVLDPIEADDERPRHLRAVPDPKPPPPPLPEPFGHPSHRPTDRKPEPTP